YAIRHGLMQDLSKETVTFRNKLDERALPMRQFGAFLIGNGVVGAGSHWNGDTWFFAPYDFEIKTMTDKKYGKNKLPKDYTLQDWGITFDELHPYYLQFEKTAGTSGELNPLRPERTEDYPTPPMKNTPILERYMEACKDLDLHPFRQPSANISEAYKNPDGQTLAQCQYCGFC